SEDKDLKHAGIQALGQLGDASAIPTLVEALDNPSWTAAAATSLSQLVGKGVDGKLIATLGSEKIPRKTVALIGILERRKASGAVPAILKAARSDDARIRASAFSALPSLAEPNHVQDILTAMIRIKETKHRDVAGQAIVKVCRKISDPEKRARPILDSLAALARAGSPSDATVA